MIRPTPAGRRGRSPLRKFAIAALALAALPGCEPAAPPDRSPEAKQVCRDFVRNRLRVPATARFQDLDAFQALPGKPKKDAASPASAIAAAVAKGVRDPVAGSRLINSQLGFLDELQVTQIENLGGSGRQDEARAIIQAALTRRTQQSDYVVAGYVDGQNDFGVVSRSNFICFVSAEGARDWKEDGVALGYW
jgi:hypothetical protein